MGNSLKLRTLRQALLITEKMQFKADNALWDDLNVLERERDKLWVDVFPLGVNEVSERLLVEKIVLLNGTLELQCCEAKMEVRGKLQRMNSNKKAVKVYQAT